MSARMSFTAISDTLTGISLQKLFLDSSWLVDEFSELDEMEVSTFVLLAFILSLRNVPGDGASDKLSLQNASTPNEAVEQTLGIKEYMTATFSSSSMNLQDVVKLLDKDRRLGLLERFFLPNYLGKRALRQKIPTATQCRRVSHDAAALCQDFRGTTADVSELLEKIDLLSKQQQNLCERMSQLELIVTAKSGESYSCHCDLDQPEENPEKSPRDEQNDGDGRQPLTGNDPDTMGPRDGGKATGEQTSPTEILAPAEANDDQNSNGQTRDDVLINNGEIRDDTLINVTYVDQPVLTELTYAAAARVADHSLQLKEHAAVVTPQHLARIDEAWSETLRLNVFMQQQEKWQDSMSAMTKRLEESLGTQHVQMTELHERLSRLEYDAILEL